MRSVWYISHISTTSFIRLLSNSIPCAGYHVILSEVSLFANAVVNPFRIRHVRWNKIYCTIKVQSLCVSYPRFQRYHITKPVFPINDLAIEFFPVVCNKNSLMSCDRGSLKSGNEQQLQFKDSFDGLVYRWIRITTTNLFYLALNTLNLIVPL